ncbi:MAG: hypothetical protein ACPIOQ_29885 [Promethearchaeia archaeon]
MLAGDTNEGDDITRALDARSTDGVDGRCTTCPPAVRRTLSGRLLSGESHRRGCAPSRR